MVEPTDSHLAVHTLTFAIPPANRNDNDNKEDDTSRRKKVIAHAQVRLDHGDVVKLVIPHYKPKSYSMSALRLTPEQEFDVTFKVYPNGRASGYLNRLQLGDTIQSFGMAKNKCRNPGGKWIGIVAYGVGITEALPVARAELERPGPGPPTTVTLLWASRTLHDTFWHDQIQALQHAYPCSPPTTTESSSETNSNNNDSTNRFEMAFLFSRESNEFFQALSSSAAASNATTTTSQVHIPVSILQARHVLSGRVTASVLSTVFDQACHEKEHARFLSVGTKDMMAFTSQLLTNKLGFCFPHNELLPKQTNDTDGANDNDQEKKKQNK